jgi:amino acid adenylation domain-containing protein
MTEASTLAGLLQKRAARHPERTAFVYLVDGEREEVVTSYGELDRRARSVAAAVEQRGCAGEPVLLVYPPGPAFIAAFFGCLYARAIAVPVYPPRRNQSIRRITGILQDTKTRHALATEDTIEHAARHTSQAPRLEELEWVATDTLDDSAGEQWTPSPADPGDTAFLQYTSGSTGTPKGVMVSRANLMANQSMIQQAFGHTGDETVVGWLPLYHDMGLIGNLMQPIYLGTRCVLMSPIHFLKRPIRWFRAISHYGAHTSGGPNFGYARCVEKIDRTDCEALQESLREEEGEDFDLSCWQLAYNGSEPVRAQTMKRFAEKFAPFGFEYEAFYPTYGLAEGTLIVTGSDPDAAPITSEVDAASLENGTLTAAAEDDRDDSAPARTQTLVSSGHPVQDVTVRVVDPDTHEPCRDGEVGEIWMTGPSRAKGYWNRPDQTASDFEATIASTDDPDSDRPFLRTGDLGAMQDGELFVTGRRKDLIVVRGRNVHPHDVEHVAYAAHDALRKGCGAAFGIDVDGPGGTEERVALVHEVRRVALRDFNADAVAQAIRDRVAREMDLRVHAICFIKPARIPKTSSGKVRRYACRRKYLQNDFDPVAVRVLDAAGQEEAEPGTDSPETAAQDSGDDQPVLSRSMLTGEPEGRRYARALDGLRRLVAGVVDRDPDQVDLDAALTSVGLDSVGAADLAARLEDTVGTRVGVPRLLSGITLMDLTDDLLQHLDDGEGETGGDGVRAGEEVTGRHPATFGQEDFWARQTLHPESAAYQIFQAFALSPDVDREALLTAFSTLVDRHPALRTTYAEVDDRIVQKVNGPGEELEDESGAVSEREVLDLGVVDASGWDENRLRSYLHAEAHRPFNLETDPVLRVRLAHSAVGDRDALLIVVHHIAVDFWSLEVFFDELRTVYAAKVEGTPPDLPSSPRNPVHYSKRERRLLDGREGSRMQAHWQHQLSSAPTTLNLVPDYPRPAVFTTAGGRVQTRFETGLTQSIKNLARDREVTPYVVLLAAYHLLLHRYSGQNDLLVGTPIGAREAGWTDTVGYLVHPAAIRARLEGRPRFGDLVSQVDEAVKAAMRNRNYPFGRLVDDLNVPRDASRTPIFQAFFVFQQSHRIPEAAPLTIGHAREPLRLHDGQLVPIDVPKEATQFELQMMVAEFGDEMAVTLRYNRDLFARSTAEAMLSHYESLLEAATDAPSAPVDELATGPESDVVPESWTSGPDVPRRPAGEDLLLQRMSAQSEATPDRLALAFDAAPGTETPGGRSDHARPQHLTFAALDRAARHLAARLREAGAGPETVVGVFADRSPALVTALRGIWTAEAAYLPLGPDLPDARLQAMLADADPACAVAPPERAEAARALCRAAGTETTVLPWSLREAVRAGASRSPEADRPSPNAGDLAYLLYTSGSTGRPKGVEVEHGAIANRIAWMQEAYPIGGSDRGEPTGELTGEPTGELTGEPTSDRLLQKTPAGFDVSVWELFWGQVEGVALQVAPPGAEKDPARLEALVERHRLTTVHFVPSMLRGFLQHRSGREEAGSTAAGDAPALTSLRRVVCSGEELTPALKERFGERVREVQRAAGAEPASLHNLYGPTEAAVDVTRHRCRFGEEEEDRERARVPIGRPVAGTQAYVLDPETLAPVPVGAPGELVLGGVQLARGYRGRARQTAEAFVPDPFAEEGGGESGTRMYRTGDRVRWTEGGELEFLGRIDRQVQVRGVRVEPEEVEAQMEAIDGVAQAAVAVRDDDGETALTGYVCPERTAADFSAQSVQSALRDCMPRAMVPSPVVFVDQMPQTGSGKVDRRALPDPSPTSDRRAEPPQTDVERVVAKVWTDVLGVDTVGRTDHFFDCGGNSLDAARVASRLREHYDVEIPVRSVLQKPTVHNLASLIEVHAMADDGAFGPPDDQTEAETEEITL